MNKFTFLFLSLTFWAVSNEKPIKAQDITTTEATEMTSITNEANETNQTTDANESSTSESKYIIDTEVSWPEINQSFEEQSSSNMIEEFNDQTKSLIVDQISIIKEQSKTSSIFVQAANHQLSSSEDATKVLPADDLIKLFIAAVYFYQIETKQITADDMVNIADQEIIPGSTLANLPQDKSYSLKVLVQLMLQSHDNMATDLLIESLGGLEKVNQQIQELGFIQTTLVNNMATELSGAANQYNETSASDLANLLLALFQGVLFDEDINHEALTMYSQHGPIGIANSLDNNQLFYGLKAKAMQEGMLHDALLYEVESEVPVVIVVMSEQLNDADNRLDNLGYQLNHLIIE
ncbi:class A beta-lactamase-related serine hydrolase [Globicatella sulfidifaciens]|uniref:serine hydrolase n=1 Tax=Globicatella sulfidifaciens TaxID=136093 RepID=UPI00288DF97E|nr:serine hydrolase [Globicatella sulfidifaciens]MDT2767511.1 class A beta-lactamase-related serine hydrolase [Globicatella sulfidifaciens]